MPKPQPARDDTCPVCPQVLGPGYYSQRKTCTCGAWLIYAMDGPTPRWIPVREYDPQTGSRSPLRGKPHIRIEQAYPPKEAP